MTVFQKSAHPCSARAIPKKMPTHAWPVCENVCKQNGRVRSPLAHMLQWEDIEKEVERSEI